METLKDRATEVAETVADKGEKLETRTIAPAPTRIPSAPPAMETRVDSIRNCKRIS